MVKLMLHILLNGPRGMTPEEWGDDTDRSSREAVSLDLARHEEKQVPPCVRYSITKYGWTLTPVLEQICGWGRIHLVRLEKGARQ